MTPMKHCGVAAAALFAELWLRRQPVWDGTTPPRLTLPTRLVSLVLRPGVRLTGGAPWRTGLYSWVAWTLAGWLVVGALFGAAFDWRGQRVVHGLLAMLFGAAAGAAAGTGVGILIATRTHMSSVEGKSGFFVLGIALLGGIVGLLAGTVAAALILF